MPESRTPSAGYQLFMIVLCAFALVLFILQAVFRANREIAQVLQWADTGICVVFLFDFVQSFVRAPNRSRYFFTWGWVDLLSSIPALDAARWGRLARIVRLARVLRALRATRVLTSRLMKNRSQSAAFVAALVALFLLVGSSAAVLHFEDPQDGNIKNAGDAVWWAFTTITTVGYGDKFPMSTEGRFIAALLMTAGVGVFGAISATLAAWFLAPDEAATDNELSALREELAALRKLIEERVRG